MTPEPVSHSAPRNIDGPPHGPLRVLVVDDDPDSREMLEIAITSIGHSCILASDGAEAWEKQRAQPVDTILCDWEMPRMSGIELCKRVRAQDDVLYTYFVLMTGRGDKEHFFQGMRAGADDYLTKPLDLEELEVRLLSATRVIKMQRALAERNAALRTESKESFNKARVDPLTESANRLRLREDLDALQSRAARYGHRYSAALCDVDQFKEYNDTFGHLGGDVALRTVAGAIGERLREGDTLYRYGGEEFLVILPEQGIEDANIVMERVRAGVEELGIPQPKAARGVLTISVGIAQFDPDHETCDDWLKRADEALYRAKRNGRNRVEIDVRGLKH